MKHLRCDEFFTTHLSFNLLVKEFLKLVNYWRTNKQTNTRLMALCPGLPRRAGTRKVKPIWILLKQETVSGKM